METLILITNILSCIIPSYVIAKLSRLIYDFIRTEISIRKYKKEEKNED